MKVLVEHPNGGASGSKVNCPSGDTFDAHAARLSGMGDFYMDQQLTQVQVVQVALVFTN